MTFRPYLSAVLRGEEARELDAATRDRLESFAHEAQAEDALTVVRDECSGRRLQPDPSPGVDYLLAVACALNGEIERALQTLLQLGERLTTAGQWEALVAVAERALGLELTHAGARLLVRAHEELGREPARIEALERAFSIVPDDLELGLLLAVRLGEAGEGDRRRALLTELIPAFAREERYAGLEEAALEFVDHGAIEGLVTLVRALPGPAAAGALQECEGLLKIAFPEVAREGRAGECEAALRKVALTAFEQTGAAGAAPFRAPLAEALRQGTGAALPNAAAVVAASGVADKMKPLPEALDRFDRIAVLPPGRAVWHDTFKAGRVMSDDGDHLAVDFARSKGHRMPYAAAKRTLTPMPEDDLRLLHFTQPAEIVRLRTDEPAEVVARALGSLGGTADAQRLKVFLVGTDIVPLKEWTAFWRRARAAAAKHPRLDTARAFEETYRLRAPEELAAEAAGEASATAAGDVPLPAYEVRKPARTNLAALRKFLTQHPGAESALTVRFGKFIERTLFDEDGELTDRARAGLYFARWYPDRAGEWSTTLQKLWEQGLAVTDLSGEDEQLALLEASHAAGVEADAILSALDSRYPAVREEAHRYRSLLDDAGRAGLRMTLLLHAPRYPGAALRLIEDEVSARGGTPGDIWRVLWSALALIENRPKPSLAAKILGWLEPGGVFERLLEARPCPEEIQLKTRVLFRTWRSSDRFLFPALEALERLGLAGEVQAIRAERQERSDKLFEGVGQQAEGADLPVMTRATWERLNQELERLERELRTTIPQAIQKARELGDLKENAEYHSAKLKQANVSRLVASLQLRLARARFVDEVEYKDGVAGLGTEVVLESADQELRTFWILGEDEHHHGGNVVSFQAPVGRSLVGLTIGDEVDLGEGAERKRWHVVSVERKLPDASE